MFLSSELQAAQMVRNRRITENQQEESPVCQELLSLCSTLNIPKPRGLDTAGIFSEVQDRVGMRNLPLVQNTDFSYRSFKEPPVLASPCTILEWSESCLFVVGQQNTWRSTRRLSREAGDEEISRYGTVGKTMELLCYIAEMHLRLLLVERL